MYGPGAAFGPRLTSGRSEGLATADGRGAASRCYTGHPTRYNWTGLTGARSAAGGGAAGASFVARTPGTGRATHRWSAGTWTHESPCRRGSGSWSTTSTPTRFGRAPRRAHEPPFDLTPKFRCRYTWSGAGPMTSTGPTTRTSGPSYGASARPCGGFHSTKGFSYKSSRWRCFNTVQAHKHGSTYCPATGYSPGGYSGARWTSSCTGSATCRFAFGRGCGFA